MVIMFFPIKNFKAANIFIQHLFMISHPPLWQKFSTPTPFTPFLKSPHFYTIPSIVTGLWHKLDDWISPYKNLNLKTYYIPDHFNLEQTLAQRTRKPSPNMVTYSTEALELKLKKIHILIFLLKQLCIILSN